MIDYKQLFVDHMNEKGVRYTPLSLHSFQLLFGGENMDTITVIVHFDEDGDNMITVFSMDIANFRSNEANGIWVCNELNKSYRWVRFFIDDDADLVVACDALIDETTCGEECMDLVNRVVSIVDEAYIEIMKAKLNLD